MKIKKCCYMERDCTPACVAYSSAKELSESSQEMGLNDMHCVRLISDIVSLANMPDPEDFEEEEY
jgi:hypothetical protein